MVVYALIRLELDDFSGLDTRWVPDLDSLRAFTTERDRDGALAELDAGSECYEEWMPLEIKPICHDDYLRATRCSRFDIDYPRDGKGRFKKYLCYEGNEGRKAEAGEE